MMLEIARLWSSIAHYEPERDRYEIHGVMGPDEFHERYPGAAEGGLRNNAYTRPPRRCSTSCRRAARRPCGRGWASATRRSGPWQEMSRKMFVPFHGDGIVSQFEGYEDLEGLEFSMQFRGTPMRVQLGAGELTVTAHPEGQSRPIRVGLGEDVRELCPGDRCSFAFGELATAQGR
jgi:trehalose/maltose hydrolase-like predicted phosphorylase